MMSSTNMIQREVRLDKNVKPKARRGSGSIFQKENCASWFIQYYVHGKRRRESAHTSDKQAAQALLTQRLRTTDMGETIPVRRKAILIEELYRGIERDYVVNAHRSLKALRLRWQHLKPFFGDHTAGYVTKEVINSYIDTRLQEGAARATVNREIAALKRMFHLSAQNLHKLPEFPERIKEKNIRQGFVSFEEFTLLAAKADSLWMRAFLEIAWSICWRSSEIVNLRVGQVHIRERILRLEACDTKNQKGRESPMTEKMVQLLRECIAGKAKTDFVLTRSTRRGQKHVRNFRKAWTNLVTNAGMPGLLVHDLRRSGARQLRLSGIAESTIMSLAGWETSSVFKRYDIQDNKDKHLAMIALEQKRLADQAKLDEEKQQAESEFSPKYSPNFPLDGKDEPHAPSGWKQ